MTFSNAWTPSVSLRDLDTGEAHIQDPPGGFLGSFRTVMLGLARLGSGFFGRGAIRKLSSEFEDESEELPSLSSLSSSLVDEDEDEDEVDDPSSERVSLLPYSKTPSPRFCKG